MEYLYQPRPLTERQAYIENIALEDRTAAYKHGVLAQSYETVTGDDPDLIRQAIDTILAEEAPTRQAAKQAIFSDSEEICNRYLDHTEKAERHTSKTLILEKWAGALFDNRDSEAIVVFEDLERSRLSVPTKSLERTYWYSINALRVNKLVEMECELLSNKYYLADLTASLSEADQALETGEGLEEIDVSMVMKRRDLGRLVMQHTDGQVQDFNHPTLVKIKKELLTKQIEELTAELVLPEQVLEAVKTGVMPPQLAEDVDTILKTQSKRAQAEQKAREAREQLLADPESDILVEDLDHLSVRAFHALRREGIVAVSELVSMTSRQVKWIDLLGDRGYESILTALAARDLALKED